MMSIASIGPNHAARHAETRAAIGVTPANPEANVLISPGKIARSL
jgi:hypothetical protein